MFTTRFAPSPTGYLHLGHAFAAHTAWRRARESGGRFLLRLEDIDPARCRPEYAAAIEEDLRWLGLDWDGEVLTQSTRLPLYRAALDSLAARHLIYPCFCSRADIAREVAASALAPHTTPDGTPLYPGTCRHLPPAARVARLAANQPYAWRLDMERALQAAPALYFTEQADGPIRANPRPFGDIILARRDAPASYHLCVTHDDAAQGVTLVTRGEDLKPATHLHRLLQHLMDWPAPAYAHHRLLMNTEGHRLSKRANATSIRAQRLAGTSPDTILANWNPAHATEATFMSRMEEHTSQ